MNAILLARLFSASVSLAALTLLALAVIKVFRIHNARLRSILWLLVLAKLVCVLLLGSAVILPIRIRKTPPPTNVRLVHPVHFVHTTNIPAPTPP